jgi:hypothetical protein
MLVAVLMIFVVFSFTGVAALNVAYISSSSSAETVNNIKLQYAMESSVNESLWRINNGPDSLVNVTTNGITTIFNPVLNTLSVNVDKFQMETEIVLDLADDTHFDRGIAAEGNVDLDGYSDGSEEDHEARGGFNFLPEADLQYFLDNATAVHTNSFKIWKEDTFPAGIHVFTGNYIALQDIRMVSGTLVFTGHHISFWGDNEITAPQGDSTGTFPALVFTNPSQELQIYSMNGNETIIGAIYCKGDIEVYNGNISGPIIGKNVTLRNHFNLLDEDNSDRYRWTKGFGQRKNYDWPKQIGRWKTKAWKKKHNQA